jgi:hypothetical protein
MAKTRSPYREWTTTEHRVVATICPLRGAWAAYKALGGSRTYHAVRMYAGRAGIPIAERSYPHKLSDDDTADLRSDARRAIRWPGMSIRAIARELGVWHYAVAYQIRAGRELPDDEDE